MKGQKHGDAVCSRLRDVFPNRSCCRLSSGQGSRTFVHRSSNHALVMVTTYPHQNSASSSANAKPCSFPNQASAAKQMPPSSHQFLDSLAQRALRRYPLGSGWTEPDQPDVFCEHPERTTPHRYIRVTSEAQPPPKRPRDGEEAQGAFGLPYNIPSIGHGS